jgi:hypothetical protein
VERETPNHQADEDSAERADAKYYVYVVELDDGVGKRIHPDKPSIYVGQSARPPEERFDQHKRGYRASRYVRKYGVRLRPRLYKEFNPLPDRASSEAAEIELARRLRKRGYTVFGGH